MEKADGIRESMLAAGDRALSSRTIVIPRILASSRVPTARSGSFRAWSGSRTSPSSRGIDSRREGPDEPMPSSCPTWRSRSSARATPRPRWSASARSTSRSGCDSIWLVDPENAIVTVYRAGRVAGTVYERSETLEGEDVLPGFRLVWTISSASWIDAERSVPTGTRLASLMMPRLRSVPTCHTTPVPALSCPGSANPSNRRDFLAGRGTASGWLRLALSHAESKAGNAAATPDVVGPPTPRRQGRITSPRRPSGASSCS